MRWWLRSLAIGAGVGLGCGFVIGGLLGRIYMRVLFLVEEDARGLRTAFGAIVGDFTAGGTAFIFVFGGYIGAGLGLAYVALRPLMPPGIYWRELLFVTGATAAMLPFIIRQNLEDFGFLPVTLSLVLISVGRARGAPGSRARRAARARSAPTGATALVRRARPRPGGAGRRRDDGRRGRVRSGDVLVVARDVRVDSTPPGNVLAISRTVSRSAISRFPRRTSSPVASAPG